MALASRPLAFSRALGLALLSLAVACGGERGASSPDAAPSAPSDGGPSSADDASVTSPSDAGGSQGDGSLTDGSLGDGSLRDSGAPLTDGSIQDANVPLDAAAKGWSEPYGLLSLNLHCLKTEGTPFATNPARFAAIARAAQAEGVAVILAQELCIRPGESAADLLKAALETASGTSWSATTSFVHKAWEGSADEADEHIGVFVRGTLSSPTATRFSAQGALTRAMLAVRLPPSLGALLAVTLHLDHAETAVRTRQAAEAAAYALAQSDPALDVVIGGDLNALAGDPAHTRFLSAGFRALTAPLGAWHIDHVFAHRAAPIAARDAQTLFEAGGKYPQVSDHPGVLVRLAPAAAESVKVTRVIASATIDPSRPLALRGSVSPLTWTDGVPLFATGPASAKAVLTEMASGPFEYKLVRDESTWQNGPNMQGMGQNDNFVTPSFP